MWPPEGMDEAQERERAAIGRTFLRQQMGGPATLEESDGKLKGLRTAVKQSDEIV